jgi:hypothetical protein
MFNSNTIVWTHLKSSSLNQRKTIALFAADAGGTGRSRAFVVALHRARSRTVSKAERSTIISTMLGIVNDMTEIDLSRSVCR